MNTVDFIRPQLDSLQRRALPVGVVGLLMTVAGYFVNSQTFFHSYLVNFLFWFGVTMGSFAWLMIHQVAGSGALFVARRPLEAGTRLIPLSLLFFVPLLIPFLTGHHPLYEWSHADVVAHDKLLQMKQPYLNVPFFMIRVVIYFGSWIWMASLVHKWSRQQESGDGPVALVATHKLAMWSSFFLLTYVMTMTFAIIDWVMSLTPHWFSSLFGVIFIVGQGLSTLALMHVLLTYITNSTELTQWVPKRYFRDLGNLTLAFILLWAYTNFSQWVIIWSGNIAEEADWYVNRVQTGWVYVGALLIACHFVLPFFTLLSSALKVKIQNLAKLAMFIILMRFIDLNYYITATFQPHAFDSVSNLMQLNWLTLIGGFIGLGGIWLFLWAKQLAASKSLLADNDPRFVGQYLVPENPTVVPDAHTQEVIAHG